VGTVVDISTRLPVDTQTVEPAPHARQYGYVFDCGRCNAPDQCFKLFATGEIKCADCGARMNNLQVTLKDPKHAA
jgi:hypothetical protein